MQALTGIFAPYAGAAAYRINFIQEDDARRVGARLLEQIPHTARTHPHKHLNEVRAGDAEEGDVSFSCRGFCEERLACQAMVRGDAVELAMDTKD